MSQIDAIIAQVLEVKRDENFEKISMENLGSWDSLRNMELIAAIEREYGFELSFEEITEMVSVENIRSVVEKKQSQI